MANHRTDMKSGWRRLPICAELAHTLRTGDLLLYGGFSPLSRRLKRLQRSRWSHVAMIVEGQLGKGPLLWEATAEPGMTDLLTGETRGGVQLVDLNSWLEAYPADMALRRLTVARSPEMLQRAREFGMEVHGRPYEVSKLELLRALVNRWWGRNRRENLASLFCSELVAATYQRMGLLAAQPPANSYKPKDFSSERRKPLPWIVEARLEPEIELFTREPPS